MDHGIDRFNISSAAKQPVKQEASDERSLMSGISRPDRPPEEESHFERKVNAGLQETTRLIRDSIDVATGEHEEFVRALKREHRTNQWCWMLSWS